MTSLASFPHHPPPSAPPPRIGAAARAPKSDGVAYALALLAPTLALAVVCSWAIEVAGAAEGLASVLMGAQVAAATVAVLGLSVRVLSAFASRR